MEVQRNQSTTTSQTRLKISFTMHFYQELLILILLCFWSTQFSSMELGKELLIHMTQEIKISISLVAQ
ncbi:corticosteroid-binding globulin [Biomphalaria glabrata]